MNDETDIFDRLSRPFPSSAISWRVGSTNKEKTKGMALAYIDARDVMERLDEVVGPGCWQNEYTHASKDGYICRIGIKIDGEWIWKANGAGETQVEAEKGAASDAFKRAAVLWGIGQYLYSLDSPWVELDEFKRIVKTEYAKLEEVHDKAIQGVEWGHRSAVNAYRVLIGALKQFAQTDEMVRQFLTSQAGTINNLPVAMKRHLNQEAERLIDAYRAKIKEAA